MVMRAYYNEIDIHAAQWLRELIAAGEISDGFVDGRSITEVRAEDIGNAERVHLFAGIGGWDLALRVAGWPADRPVWTASLPCQPFSIAGKGKGVVDERHLWPVAYQLIRECTPAVLVGEHVASKLGRAWLSTVFADLEGLGYAVAAADLCAAGAGAPHIRQRLYWVAQRNAGLEGRQEQPTWEERETAERGGDADGMGNSGRQRRQQVTGSAPGDEVAHGRARRDRGEAHSDHFSGGPGESGWDVVRCGDAGGIGITNGAGPLQGCQAAETTGHGRTVEPAGWDDVVHVPCSDGKARPLPRAAKSGAFKMAPRFPPLVVRGGDTGSPDDSAEARVMRLKGYGNAVNIEVAVTFVRSVINVLQEQEGPG